MDAKHTPGPWCMDRMRLGADKDRRSGFVVNGPDADSWPQRVCDMRCGRDKGWVEAQANAALIAAAPDLLAACEAMSALLSEAGEWLCDGGWGTENAAIGAQSNAAIAKARGATDAP